MTTYEKLEKFLENDKAEILIKWSYDLTIDTSSLKVQLQGRLSSLPFFVYDENKTDIDIQINLKHDYIYIKRDTYSLIIESDINK